MSKPIRIARRSKYGNRRVEVDGHRFDSQREANRYGELRLLERAGKIRGLELQPSFDLVVCGLKVGSYRGDFGYLDEGERRVVEDAKGVRTPVYKLKKLLLKALHGIDIVEV